MNKFIKFSSFLALLFSVSLAFAVLPPPPAGVAMLHFGSFGLFKSNPNFLVALEECRGMAKANSPLCPGNNNCDYEFAFNFALNISTGQASGLGAITIVNAGAFTAPSTAPVDVVKLFPFSGKLDFTTLPATGHVTGHFIVQGPSGIVKLKALIHFPLPASAFPPGACTTGFCYLDGLTNTPVQITADQQLFGYNSTRTYLIVE